jgi:hypothetical protein
MILKKSHPLVVGIASAVTFLVYGLVVGSSRPLVLAVIMGAFIAAGRFRERAGKVAYPAWVMAALALVLLLAVATLVFLTGVPSGINSIPAVLLFAFGGWLLHHAWRQARG